MLMVVHFTVRPPHFIAQVLVLQLALHDRHVTQPCMFWPMHSCMIAISMQQACGPTCKAGGGCCTAALSIQQLCAVLDQALIDNACQCLMQPTRDIKGALLQMKME